MFGQHRFLTDEILAQSIDFAQRVFVVVGCFREERDDLGRIEALQLRTESLLTEIEWGDPHDALGGRRAGVGGRRTRRRRSAIEHQILAWCETGVTGGRLPKIAVPTRTMVDPSSTAAS